MVINFITSNQGKIASLNKYLAAYNLNNIIVNAVNLNIIEPQADTVAEVSLSKAKQAFDILRAPVLVEDGGLSIEALNGFPGVYSKYINTTIGANGIIKLMVGEKNRRANYISTATFIDEKGMPHQFHRQGGGEVLITESVSKTNNPNAWSDMWKISFNERIGKVLSDMTPEEFALTSQDSKSSIKLFVEWLSKNHQKL